MPRGGATATSSVFFQHDLFLPRRVFFQERCLIGSVASPRAAGAFRRFGIRRELLLLPPLSLKELGCSARRAASGSGSETAVRAVGANSR